MAKKEKMSEPIRTEEQRKAFFEDLHNLLWNEAGLSPERALEHMTMFFSYLMMEPHIDALKLPDVCKWSSIAASESADIMHSRFSQGIDAFSRHAVTAPFFQEHKIERIMTLDRIVRLMDRLDQDTLHDTDVLGTLFEYMLGRGMSTMADEGQYFTHRKVCRLAFELALEIRGGRLTRPDGKLCTFADWFCGTGGFVAEYVRAVKERLPEIDWKEARTQIYAVDMNQSAIRTTLLNLLILTGIPFRNTTVQSRNSFYDSMCTGPNALLKSDARIDYLLTNPPYGGDKTKGDAYKFKYYDTVTEMVAGKEKKCKKYRVNLDIQSIGVEDHDKVSAGMQLCMATLALGGVAAVVLPQGFFFGAAKKVVELRRKLAEEYRIHYVVDIPSGIFDNTATKTSMLVFQKGVGPTETVRFLDMDRNELQKATLEKLRESGYTLNHGFYKVTETPKIDGFQWRSLKDIVSFQRGKSLTKSQIVPGPYPVIGGGVAPMGYHEAHNRGAQAILVSQSGENAGHISRYAVPVWASDCFSMHALDPEVVDEDYLYYAVRLHLKDRIHGLRTGTCQPHVYPTTIENLMVPLPSMEMQRRIVGPIRAIEDILSATRTTLQQTERGILELISMHEMLPYPRRPLKEIASIEFGKRIVKSQAEGTLYPVYGGGGETFKTDEYNREGHTCKLSRFGVSEDNLVQMIYGTYWLNDSGMTIGSKRPEEVSSSYLGYSLLLRKKALFTRYARGTAQKNLDTAGLLEESITIPSRDVQDQMQIIFRHAEQCRETIAWCSVAINQYVQKMISTAQ